MKSIFTVLIVILCVSLTIMPQGKKKKHKTDNDSSYIEISEQDCGYGSFNIGAGGSGISFGNSEYHTGFRFNYRDCGVKRINGLNFTLWQGYERTMQNSRINGISFGTVPTGGEMNGITCGILGAVGMQDMTGINLGGLAVVTSGGSMTGINMGGLALVSPGGDITGINFGGLGIVSPGGSITGINISSMALVSLSGGVTGFNMGGLAVVSPGGSITGINLGGLALVSPGGSITGINIGGLALVSPGGSITGLNMGGLAVVSPGGSITGANFSAFALVSPGGSITGLNIAGVAVVTPTGSIEGINFAGAGLVALGSHIVGLNTTLGTLKCPGEIKGFNFGGYKIEAGHLIGINTAVCWIEAGDLTGFTVTGYCRVKGTQTGLSIALVNNAENLNGVQIGLLNIAKNNGSLSTLPFVNVHIGI